MCVKKAPRLRGCLIEALSPRAVAPETDEEQHAAEDKLFLVPGADAVVQREGRMEKVCASHIEHPFEHECEERPERQGATRNPSQGTAEETAKYAAYSAAAEETAHETDEGREERKENPDGAKSDRQIEVPRIKEIRGNRIGQKTRGSTSNEVGRIEQSENNAVHRTLLSEVLRG